MMEAARQLSDPFAARRDDEAAQELEQLRPLGEAFLMRRFGGQVGRADAEDAVAEVILRLHRKTAAGEGPRNLRAAFFTSVRNAAIDQLRSRAARPTAALEEAEEAPAPEPSAAEHVLAREDAVRLQEVLARMRSNYREAIVLRFGVGLTVPEIAERLQISLPAAKKLVLRATAQARDRLVAIEGRDFCPQVRELAQRVVVESGEGAASASERRTLQAHLHHCGGCRSFLASFQHNLHELGGAALLTGVGDRAGVGDQLARWLAPISEAGHTLSAKARLIAFRAGDSVGGGDVSGAGALANTGQKVIAICGAATATTATCLATGVVGPGVGAIGADHGQAHSAAAPPAQTRTLSELPTAPPPEASETETPAQAPAEAASPSPKPEEESSPPPEPEPTPSEAASEEFGFESSASTAQGPPPEPASPPPAPAPAPSSTGSGGGGGGTEHFGFGG